MSGKETNDLPEMRSKNKILDDYWKRNPHPTTDFLLLEILVDQRDVECSRLGVEKQILEELKRIASKGGA